MSDISKDGGLASIFGFGWAAVLLVIVVLIMFFVDPSNFVGTIIYLVGFVMIGHGINIFGVVINVFMISAILGFTFATWYGIKHAIEWFIRPIKLDMMRLIALWLIIFFAFLIMYHLIGYGLMYLDDTIFSLTEKHFIPRDVEFTDPITKTYREWDGLIDYYWTIPTIIIIWFTFAKGVYHYMFKKDE